MDIFECERKAREIGFNSAKFKAVFPSGVFECQWLDAYMGIFKVDADGLRDGFLMSRQVDEMFPGFHCFDLQP